jgi:hypothetical protein
LHDDVRRQQRPARLKQAPQYRRRAIERQACDDVERLMRQCDAQDVGLYDLREPTTQSSSELGIELDCNHTRTDPRERACQDTGAGAEVEHEVARPHSGCANDLRCERATAEEVLSAR